MQWSYVEANLPKTWIYPLVFSKIFVAFTAQIALDVQTFINSYVHIKAINNKKLEVYSSNYIYPAYLLAIGK